MKSISNMFIFILYTDLKSNKKIGYLLIQYLLMELSVAVSLVESLLDLLPVDNLPNVFDILCSDIFVVDIVSMLPNINSYINNIVLKRGVKLSGTRVY